MIDKMIKTFYIVMIALIIFLGGLLISEGLNIASKEPAPISGSAIRRTINDLQEGNAL